MIWVEVLEFGSLCIYRFERICKCCYCYMSLSKLHPPTAQTNPHIYLKFGMDTHVMPNMAPAHPHATGVAVYPALLQFFQVIDKFRSLQIRKS